MQRTFLSDDGETFSLDDTDGSRIGAGGQGQVYGARIGRQPMAVKLMKHADGEKLKALQQLEQKCGELATLPKLLVYESHSGQPGALAGYAMRRLESSRSMSAARLFNFEEIGRLTRYTWKDAVFAALRLAESVAHVHRHGVVIGDLNPENVLFEQQPMPGGTSTWRAILLDTDSFQIATSGGARHLCPVSRPLYTAPELIGRDFSQTWRLASSDDFSLAVVIYQLLLHDHPYDNAINPREPDLDVSSKIRRGLYPHAQSPHPGLRPSPYRPSPSQISDTINRAFQSSFRSAGDGLGVLERPTAAEWVVLLRDLHRHVVPCSHSPHHHHPSGKECLWCAVDAKVGHPLCQFPNSRPRRPPPPPSPVPPRSTPSGQASRDTLQKTYGSLLQQVEALLRRRQRLIQQTAVLKQRMERLELSLRRTIAESGDSARLFDRPALERRMHPLRNWMSLLVGHHAKVKQRQKTLELLSRVVIKISSGVMESANRLQAQRLDLASRLSILDDGLGPQPKADLPPALSAITLLRAALTEEQERWVTRQLEQQPIRTWKIDGFGEGRLALLESRGLINGEHLRCHIDRLTAVPGIGKGLQGRLRMHLDGVIDELRSQLAGRTWPLRLEQLVDPAEATRISTSELALEDLLRQQDSLENTLVDLQQGVAIQLRERDRLLQEFAALF